MTVFVRTSQSGLRIGIRTPKSIGNAVKRNRARRIIREIFRRNKCRISGGFEIVCIARDNILRNIYEQNVLEFMSILLKAGCLKDFKERADSSDR
jgi:ribonuclease P protein component